MQMHLIEDTNKKTQIFGGLKNNYTCILYKVYKFNIFVIAVAPSVFNVSPKISKIQ